MGLLYRFFYFCPNNQGYPVQFYSLMKTVFDRYRKFYKKPDAHEKAKVVGVTVERVDDDHSPVYVSPVELANPDLSKTGKKEPPADVAKLIRQLLDQEA